MRILNIHKREISQPKSEIAKLLKTLASDNDLMLATEKWSPMILDNGLVVGSAGGHGPIKYFVKEYKQDHSITFQFTLNGFNGFHTFEISEIEGDKTILLHRIDMTTSGIVSLKWALVIRWLHDAYIEDAFDKVENYFTENKKKTEWSLWVKTLRKIMKPKIK